MKTSEINLNRIKFRSAKPTEFDTLATIDTATFYKAIDFNDLHQMFLKSKLCIKTILYGKKIVGYFIVRFLQDRYIILRMVLAEEYKRRKIGTRVIEQLINKLRLTSRRYIEVLVDERNLPAQLFLKANKFKWLKTLKDTGHDVYCMIYTAEE